MSSVTVVGIMIGIFCLFCAFVGWVLVYKTKL